jgi:hypothetical protein
MNTIYEIENRLSYFIDKINDGNAEFTQNEKTEFQELRSLLKEIMNEGSRLETDLESIEDKYAQEFAKIEHQTRTTNILVSKRSAEILKEIKKEVPEVNSYEDALDYLISHYYK